MESIEQHDRVNGHCKPKSPQDPADVRWTSPEGESGGSDSCGGTSVSELTDLQELKAMESDDEEEKVKGVVPPSKGLKVDQKKKEKESLDHKENNCSKQNSSAATSYTGKSYIAKSQDLLPGKSLEMVHDINDRALIFMHFFMQTCRIPRRPRCQNSCVLAEKTAQGLGSA